MSQSSEALTKDTSSRTALTGIHEFTGSEACVEGAFAAGCRFFAGYPIQPALEIVERFLARAPELDAAYVQMEDEISALAALLGAVWTGKKGLTATSGPGFSLMMEHVGLGVMLETPCVIVDVQRAGLSTGIPNSPGQGDMMQSRWGSHGDYEIIALSPSSPQEMFDFTVKAFNLSERYRVPVTVMTDEYVAHLKDVVRIPAADAITLNPRRYFEGPEDQYLPFKRDGDFVPRMVNIGDNYRFHVTGLTHDDRGYPVMNEECQEYNVHSIVKKVRQYADEIIEVQEEQTDDAEIVLVTYGAPGRFATEAVKQAREAGIKAGSLKLVTVWPFPEKQIARLAGKAKALVVPEMNYGQIVLEVQRCSYGRANVVFIHHGEEGVDSIGRWLEAMKKALKERDVRTGVLEY